MAKLPKIVAEQELPALSALELNRIVGMPEAARLSGLSEDSLQRHYRKLIIQLSKRRIGMRVGHALQLAAPAVRSKPERA